MRKSLIIPIIGIAGVVALDSCQTTTDEQTISSTMEVVQDNNSTNQVYWGEIELENSKSWSNSKLRHSINESIDFKMSSGNSGYGNKYDYDVYLFKNPNGEEIILLSTEEPILPGENYNIKFNRFKAGQTISNENLLENFLGGIDARIIVRKELSSEIDGVLTSYERIE